MTRISVAWVALAAALGAASLSVATSLGQPIVLRFGPADHDYTEGFRRTWVRGTSRRWAKTGATIELPFQIRKASRAVILGGRPGLDPAQIEARQSEGQPTVLTVGTQVRAHALELLPADSIRLSVRSLAARKNPSLELSKVTIVPQAPGAIVPAPGILVRVFLCVALLCAAFLATGRSGPQSLLASLGLLAVPLCLIGLVDPFAAVHLARKAVLLVPLLALPPLLLPRERAHRWLPVLAVALLSRAVVFHPSYDYKDVDIHSEVAGVAVREGPAELWRRITYYQQRFELGKASTGISSYQPFPYPPTFYTIASLLPISETDDNIKVLGVASQSLAVLLVMLLAGRLLGPGPPEMAAGLLAAFFPPDVLELLKASYPAILGHALDLAIITVLMLRWSALRTVRGTLLLALAIGAAALAYNAAPVHLAVLVPLLLVVASWPPALEGRLGLALSAGMGGLLSLLFYGPYLKQTFQQVIEGHGFATVQLTTAARIGQTLAYWDIGGVPYVLAVIGGLVVQLRRLWPRPEGRVLLGWALYPLVILALIFLSPEPFRYFRRYYLVYPLFPLLVAGLAAARRRVMVAVTLLVLAWSLYKISTFSGTFFLAPE